MCQAEEWSCHIFSSDFSPCVPLSEYDHSDELMVHQNILAGISSGNNLKDPLFIKLGAFSFGVKQNLMKEGSLAGTATLSDKIIFNGDNLHKEQELFEFKKPPDQRGYIHVGLYAGEYYREEAKSF